MGINVWGKMTKNVTKNVTKTCDKNSGYWYAGKKDEKCHENITEMCDKVEYIRNHKYDSWSVQKLKLCTTKPVLSYQTVWKHITKTLRKVKNKLQYEKTRPLFKQRENKSWALRCGKK